MTDREATDALLEWVEATLPAVADRTYPYLPSGKDKGLPDAAAEMQTSRIVREDAANFPHLAIQQAILRVRDYAVSFMVEAGALDADADQADAELHGFADALEAALLADLTLGGRVASATPFVTFDYTPPFVQYEDGTRGRQMVLRILVAELVAGE